MRINLTQYLMPDGRQQDTWVDNMPDDLESIIKEIHGNGLRLAAEMLTTGEISFTIESQLHQDDFDIEIAQNGPGPNGTVASLEKMIRRFNKEAFQEWVKQFV